MARRRIQDHIIATYLSVRLGIVVLFSLFILTFVEYWAAHLGSTVLMFIFILFKGAAIMYFFMHIAMLWRSEEAH